MSRTNHQQPPNAIAEQVERPVDEPIGPLDVYSPEHWARLEQQGYEWDEFAGAAMRGSVTAMPLPGDPAYQPALEYENLEQPATETIHCPFCDEDDFDLPGLKIHLAAGYCNRYESYEPVNSPVNQRSSTTEPLSASNQQG